MKIIVGEKGVIEISEVFNEIALVSHAGQKIYICSRNGGFEFSYNGSRYEAKGHTISKIKINKNARPVNSSTRDTSPLEK